MLASCAAWPARHAGLGSGAGLVRAWHTRSASSWRERDALDPIRTSSTASAICAGPFRVSTTVDAVRPGRTRCNSLACVARSCPRACLVFACDTRLAASRGAWDAPDAVLAGGADSAGLADSRARSPPTPVPNLPRRAVADRARGGSAEWHVLADLACLAHICDGTYVWCACENLIYQRGRVRE